MNSTRKRVHWRRWLALAGLVVAAVAALLIPRWFQPDLRAQVAAFLQVPPDQLVLNMPPASGRYPGALLLARDGSFHPVTLVYQNDRDLRKGPQVDVSWRAEAVSGGVWQTALARFSALTNSGAVTGVKLSIQRAHVLEMTESNLEARAMARVKDIPRGTLYIITRAVQGIPVLTLRRKRSASGEAWAAVRKQADNEPEIKVRADEQDAGVLHLEVKEPIVVAYVVDRAHFYSKSLGTKLDGVKLVPVSGAELKQIQKKKSVLRPVRPPT